MAARQSGTLEFAPRPSQIKWRKGDDPACAATWSCRKVRAASVDFPAPASPVSTTALTCAFLSMRNTVLTSSARGKIMRPSVTGGANMVMPNLGPAPTLCDCSAGGVDRRGTGSGGGVVWSYAGRAGCPCCPCLSLLRWSFLPLRPLLSLFYMLHLELLPRSPLTRKTSTSLRSTENNTSPWFVMGV